MYKGVVLKKKTIFLIYSDLRKITKIYILETWICSCLQMTKNSHDLDHFQLLYHACDLTSLN